MENVNLIKDYRLLMTLHFGELVSRWEERKGFIGMTGAVSLVKSTEAAEKDITT